MYQYDEILMILFHLTHMPGKWGLQRKPPQLAPVDWTTEKVLGTFGQRSKELTLKC